MSTRSIFKLREVMQLLKTGKKATLHVCSFDRNRPQKSGKLLKLRDVTLSSNNGFLEANVRHPNGEPQAIKPCLILRFNNTPVTP